MDSLAKTSRRHSEGTTKLSPLSRRSIRIYSRPMSSIHLRRSEASDENKKRSTKVLPPLERETTPPKQQPKARGSPDEAAADAHWNLKFKKVSLDVDKKVINHLRKKLNRRLERRLMDAESDASSYTENRFNRQQSPQKQEVRHHSDIFTKYSETGEKLTRSGSSSPGDRTNEKKTVTEQQTEQVPQTQTNGEPLVNGHSNGLQNGHDSTATTEDNSKDEDNVELNQSASDNDDSDNVNVDNVDNVDPQLFQLTRLETKFADNGSGDFRKLNFSPIQTPTLTRPPTREQTMADFADRMTQVLKGKINVRCPVKDNVLKMYICADFLDSVAERTALTEKVYPNMRRYCAEHGFELEIFDLKWGLKDMSLDDHSHLETSLSVLHKCVESGEGVNTLVILGERYGSYILPNTVPEDEFTAIAEKAGQYRDREMAKINDKLSEIEKARTDRDPNKQQQKDDPDKDGRIRKISISSKNSDDTGKENQNTRKRPEGTKRENEMVKDLKAKEQSLPDPQLLKDWYRLDENTVPPVYKLQNISSIYKDYSRSDVKRREAAENSWKETSAKIRKMFDDFVGVAIPYPENRRKYFVSLFDLEIENGLLDIDANNHCIIIQRTIKDARQHLDDDSLQDYFDFHPVEKRLAVEPTKRINEFRDEQIAEKVSAQFILPYEVHWISGGISSVHRPHQFYLDRMCKQVFDMFKRLQKNSVENTVQAKDPKTKLYMEVSSHVKFAQERYTTFQGRKDILQLVKSYARSKCDTPLVLHGETGSGKTAILCKVAKEVFKWFKGKNPSVLLRIITLTTPSRNVRSLLRGLCLQLCDIFKNNYQTVPTDYKGIINYLHQRLNQATKDNPIFILLDGVDQLSDEYEGRKMAWLPKQLPRNVKIILTTSSDKKYESLQSLQTILQSEDSFVEIPNLPEDDALAILDHLLRRQDKSITDEQYDLIVDAFKKCPNALYLQTVFRESLNWTSYQEIDQIKLPETVKKIITLKYGKLETKHGEPLVRRALGYISACRNGVSNCEMEDLLSLDEAVMDSIMSLYRPPKRRIPSIFWVRLREDLLHYTKEVTTGNIKTLQWAHTQYYEAAEERYLKARDKAPSYHRAIGEYFLGLWEKKPKPYSGNDTGVLRFVSAQPFYYEPEESPRDGSDRTYNLRKVNELPYQLLNSQQTNVYKTETVCNFEWILAKLCGTSLQDLVEEYQIGLQVEVGDKDLKIISDTIQLSAKALNTDPRQLAAQLIGRLHKMIQNGMPKTRDDPHRHPNLFNLYKQAHASSLPTLVPSVACLTESGGILFDLLSGHTEPITAVGLTSEGMRAITASRDNTMKVWDIRSGKVVKTLENTGTNIQTVRLANGNAYAVTVEKHIIRVWHLRHGECILTIDRFLDNPVICIANDGKFLVALFDGINLMRTWDIGQSDLPMISETKIEDKSVFKDQSVLIAPYANEAKVLHAFRGANFATVQNAQTGKIRHILKCKDDSSSVACLAMTRDYYVVCCRQQYMQLHEIHILELFDIEKGKHLRTVRGCMHDRISELYINLIGSHAIAICTSEKTATSDIAIWNIETEDHKHLAQHAGMSTIGACADFKYCLTAQTEDKTLCIWNLSGKVNQTMPKLKKTLGIEEIIPLKTNPRYCVTRQIGNGEIGIWNLINNRYTAVPVSVERGLSSPSDVIVIKDTRVIVLSERGFSSADYRPVFQKLVIYDLKTKEFIRKISNCYITPCPAHEYMVIDENHMLGLSDNRSHFVIWSLVNGQAVHRIKTNFKTLDKRLTNRDIPNTYITGGSSPPTMSRWERRSETHSAKQKRRDEELEAERRKQEDLRKEKENGIEQYIVSGDQNIIAASFFAHHLCIFDIKEQKLVKTLESESSMLFLHASALTYDGGHLVHSNYDEDNKISYVTLWDCQEGEVKRRLKNESDVMAVAITDDASRVIIGKGNNELHIWDPMKSSSLKRIQGYKGLNFNVDSKIFLYDEGRKAVVFAGDISVWDIERASVISVFTPDMRITCCSVMLDGKVIAFGLQEIPELVMLKFKGKDVPAIEVASEEMYKERPEESSDEEDSDEDY